MVSCHYVIPQFKSQLIEVIDIFQHVGDISFPLYLSTLYKN